MDGVGMRGARVVASPTAFAVSIAPSRRSGFVRQERAVLKNDGTRKLERAIWLGNGPWSTPRPRMSRDPKATTVFRAKTYVCWHGSNNIDSQS